MQPTKFRYTIIDGDQEFVLINAPAGWEDTIWEVKRSTKYWGLVRSFSVPLIHVLDGAEILKEKFYQEGVKAVMKLRIDVLNLKNWEYRKLYEGEFDFTSFKDLDNSSNIGVEITVTDVGVFEMIASYEKAVYEIEMTDDNSVMVEIPGVSIVDIAQTSINGGVYDHSDGYRILPMTVEVNEFISGKAELGLPEEEADADLSTSDNWFLKGLDSVTVNLSGKIDIEFEQMRNQYTVHIEVRNQNNEQKGSFVVKEFGVFVNIEYSFNIDVVLDEKLFIVVWYEASPHDLTILDYTVNLFTVRISYTSQTAPTLARAMKAGDLFKELIDLMNGPGVEVASSFLDESNIFITCGDAIREFDNPVIKTSFLDFYNSVDAIDSVGFGFDGVAARLERKSFFFRDVRVAELGTVKSFELEVDNDFMFNTLKVGFPEKEYEEDQGREEFNQGQVWISPNRKTKKPLERVSTYRADRHGIAVLKRLNILDNIKDKDTESDNDIFMLKGNGQMDGDVHLLETVEDYEYVAGISDFEGSFNFDFSPKKCLLRAGSFIGIGLHRFEEDLLRFGSSDKNADLITQKDGVVVHERNDIGISVLGQPLFLPYLVKITIDLPKEMWRMVDEQLYGYYEFKYKGRIWKGFVKSGSVDIGRNTERDLSLWLHKDTLMENLVI